MKNDQPHNQQILNLMEELQNLTEEYSKPLLERQAKPGSRPGSLKRKAAQYLGKGAGDKLSKTDLKRLRAKANKMKKSSKKAERERGIQLARQVSFAFNMRD
tara:strand:+ start:76 stop:381 length:306 start_codon:yes stop_codon:yes gene_type:complete